MGLVRKFGCSKMEAAFCIATNEHIEINSAPFAIISIYPSVIAILNESVLINVTD